MEKDLELIERLYRDGKMPARYYYQLNGKSAQENYLEILRERRRQNERDLREQYLSQKQEKDLQDEIEKAVAEILKTLKIR